MELTQVQKQRNREKKIMQNGFCFRHKEQHLAIWEKVDAIGHNYIK